MNRYWCVIVLMIAGNALAQAPDTLWTRTYGGSGYDYATSIVECPGQGFAFVGGTQTGGIGTNDILMVAINYLGDTLWTRTFGTSDDDYAQALTRTTDRGFVVAGFSQSYDMTQKDIFATRTDSVGNVLWSRIYAGQAAEEAYSVDTVQAGGFVIAGVTASYGIDSADFLLLRIDDLGDVIWEREYGGERNDIALSVVSTLDGGFLLAGGTDPTGSNASACYAVRVDGFGDTLWTRTIGDSGYDFALACCRTSDGGFVLAGTTNSSEGSSDDFYAVRLSPVGDTLWTRRIGSSNQEIAYSVRQTFDGGYVLAGLVSTSGLLDCYVVKIDSEGNPCWEQRYGGSSHDAANSILQSTDGGYIIAGRSVSLGAGLDDCFVVKTHPDCEGFVPASPAVVVSYSSRNAQLHWNRITQSTGGCPLSVPRYLVFHSATFGGPFYYLGFTGDTTYTHVGVITYAPAMFYEVMATTAAPANLDQIPVGTLLNQVVDGLEDDHCVRFAEPAAPTERQGARRRGRPPLVTDAPGAENARR